MQGEGTSDEKLMRLRYAGACRICGRDLPVQTEAIYERSTRTVRCADHQPMVTDPSIETVSGTAGASARREYERRLETRERRIRTKHPRIGGLIHALSDAPQSTRAWDVGAVGEERLGKKLGELASDSLRILHDRRIPGRRANIDHLAVTPTGVYVIDPKRYRGRRPSLKVEGGLVRPRREKLLVGTRDCTKLVDGVLKQVGIVRDVIGEPMAVHGVLCFIDADWPMIGGSFTTRGIDVLWPKRLYPRLSSAGEMDPERIAQTHRLLATALPSA